MDLVFDGLKLAGIGITAVFAFLILVVFIIQLMHKAVTPFAHLLEEPAKEPVKKAGIDQRMVAAAAAAAHLHKNS